MLAEDSDAKASVTALLRQRALRQRHSQTWKEPQRQRAIDRQLAAGCVGDHALDRRLVTVDVDQQSRSDARKQQQRGDDPDADRQLF